MNDVAQYIMKNNSKRFIFSFL